MKLAHKGAVCRGKRHEYRADLVYAVAVRPGKPRNTDAHVAAYECSHPLGHLLCHLEAHGALFLDERGVYAEKL